MFCASPITEIRLFPSISRRPSRKRPLSLRMTARQTAATPTEDGQPSSGVAYTSDMLVTRGDQVAVKVQSSSIDELGRKSVLLLIKFITLSNQTGHSCGRDLLNVFLPLGGCYLCLDWFLAQITWTQTTCCRCSTDDQFVGRASECAEAQAGIDHAAEAAGQQTTGTLEREDRLHSGTPW